jgi:hypothetical protein
MKRFYIFLTVLVVLNIAGCEQKDDQTGEDSQAQSRLAACPVCSKQMVEDTYCAGCNAIATLETELVHCNVCDKDFKPGTYCADCNRFMLNAKVGCVNCQGLVVKGHYCQTEKLYKGLIGVAYCEEHQQPYAEDSTCSSCKEIEL